MKHSTPHWFSSVATFNTLLPERTYMQKHNPPHHLQEDILAGLSEKAEETSANTPAKRAKPPPAPTTLSPKQKATLVDAPALTLPSNDEEGQARPVHLQDLLSAPFTQAEKNSLFESKGKQIEEYQKKHRTSPAGSKYINSNFLSNAYLLFEHTWQLLGLHSKHRACFTTLISGCQLIRL